MGARGEAGIKTVSKLARDFSAKLDRLRRADIADSFLREEFGGASMPWNVATKLGKGAAKGSGGKGGGKGAGNSKGSGAGKGGGKGAGEKSVDPAWAALLKRWNYMPEAHTDITTKHVLHVLPEHPPPANSSAEELLKCPPDDSLSASACPRKALEPILLVVHMPWFQVHTGHIRTWTLLHQLKYPCLFKRLALSMLVLVQPGELAGCERICAAAANVCTCRVAEHDRAYQHRNLMKYADGSASILYTHADTFINLPLMRQLVDRNPNATMSPSRGLQGTSYTPTPSRCIEPALLNKSREWFWHLDAKPECLSASNRLASAEGAAALGVQGARRWGRHQQCCYAWVDIAYIPRVSHAAFRAAADLFWKVQLEVAMPTIFSAIQTARIAPWGKFDCLGGCCTFIQWASLFNGGQLCAHRVNLEHATLRGVPARLHPAELCKAPPLPPPRPNWAEMAALAASRRPVPRLRRDSIPPRPPQRRGGVMAGDPSQHRPPARQFLG